MNEDKLKDLFVLKGLNSILDYQSQQDDIFKIAEIAKDVLEIYNHLSEQTKKELIKVKEVQENFLNLKVIKIVKSQPHPELN